MNHIVHGWDHVTFSSLRLVEFQHTYADPDVAVLGLTTGIIGATHSAGSVTAWMIFPSYILFSSSSTSPSNGMGILAVVTDYGVTASFSWFFTECTLPYQDSQR